MPIFSGSWTDEAGCPFDPASFALSTHKSTIWLIIEGDGDPNPNGPYAYVGTFNGKAYYFNSDHHIYIAWDDELNRWVLSDQPTAGTFGWVSNTGPDTTWTPSWGAASGNPLSDWQTNGTCRERVFGRRGGSGSPPGNHHGSDSQAACRTGFTNRMKHYVNLPTIPPPPTWESAGQDRTWLTRYGDEKKLHGQAMYPRTVIPPDYVDADHPELPELEAEPPPVDDARALWFPVPQQLICQIHWTDEYHGGNFSGWSIFQVNPAAVGHDWFSKHTHVLGHRSPLDIDHTTWQGFPFDLHWPFTTYAKLVLFYRIWYKNAFLNFGPLTSLEWPP